MIKKVSVVTIALILTNSFVVMSCNVSAKKSFTKKHFLEFNPILYMETGPYDDQIMPGGEVFIVPITIEYMVSTPRLFDFLPKFLKNILIYRNIIAPPVRIHLSVVEKPDWLDVGIASPDIYVNIKENEFSYTNTSIFIAAHRDASTDPALIVIRAESESIGRISNKSVEINLLVTPAYIPSLQIETDQELKYATFNETVTFLINVTNRANKESLIRISVDELPRNWSACLSNFEIILSTNESTTITLNVSTSADFREGDIEEICLNFTILPYPTPEDYKITPINIYHLTLFVANSSTD